MCLWRTKATDVQLCSIFTLLCGCCCCMKQQHWITLCPAVFCILPSCCQSEMWVVFWAAAAVCPSVSQSCFDSNCANAREVKTLLNFPQSVPPTNPCKRLSSSCGTTRHAAQSEWKAGRLKPDSLCVALYLQLLLLSLHNFMVSLFFTISLFHICNPGLSHVQVKKPNLSFESWRVTFGDL